MQNNSIAIVGCGLAGISASIELTKRNIQHTIFEARNIIGGRFYSFYDNHLELEIDNGQHLVFSKNKTLLNLIQFLTKNKKDELKNYFSKIKINSIPFYENGAFNNVNISPTVALKTIHSFFKSFNTDQPYPLKNLIKFLIFKNKFTIPKTISTLDFLIKARLDKQSITRFWEPFCVSVFNNSLDKIPAYLTIKILRLMFSFGKKPSFLYPSLPQSHLLDGFTDLVRSNGTEIFLSKAISSIYKEGNKFVLNTAGGEKYFFDKVILCVQPNVLKKILPEEWANHYQFFNFLYYINFNPIVSINILTSINLTSDYFGYFYNSPIHWFFNKTKMYNISGPPYFYSFTTSNAKTLINLSTSEILDILGETVERNFSISRITFNKEIILRYKVIKEKFATIDLDLKFDKYRPEQETPIDGLYIAGDWTQTNLPATLESAALSGKIAVERMLNKINLL